MNYRCVFLDWYGTLSTTLFWGHRPDLAPLATPLFSPTGSLHALLVPWMRGEYTSEEIVRATAREAGFPYDTALREFIASCVGMRLVSEEVRGAIATLRERGIKVVVATDNMDSFCRWTVPSLHLDTLCDAILSSSELGALKRDVDARGRSPFFGRFLEQEGPGRGESILLDDADDDERIQRFGIAYQRLPFGEGLVETLRRLGAEK